MIVCSCFRVSDKEIRVVVGHGATTVELVGYVCGAGLGCGFCWAVIEKIISEEKLKGSQDTTKEPAHQ